MPGNTHISIISKKKLITKAARWYTWTKLQTLNHITRNHGQGHAVP
uniref:Uncharacterized protein n=1 Tax=Arundo donax TaxID=35708 RepID=A0A0A9G5F2_ARUDO